MPRNTTKGARILRRSQAIRALASTDPFSFPSAPPFAPPCVARASVAALRVSVAAGPAWQARADALVPHALVPDEAARSSAVAPAVAAARNFEEAPPFAVV